MKTANKCPKCGAAKKEIYSFWCDSKPDGFPAGFQFEQSALCRERCKVAKLKKKVAKLKERAESAEWAVKELQKTVTTLRNPNF